MHVFMELTTDELSLPVAVADTAEKLGKMIGVKPKSIRSYISHYNKGTLPVKYPKYIRVEIEDEK